MRPYSHKSINLAAHAKQNRGRIDITMTTRFHEKFVNFSRDIARQLYESLFLPSPYPEATVIQTGSAAMKLNSSTLMPDAGIAFFDDNDIFLALEVAYSQKEHDAQRKAQKYILDSDGKIKFVVLVVVSKHRSKNAVASTALSVERHEKDDSRLFPDRDTVHVHVYKPILQAENTLTGAHVIDGVKIFPGPAPNDTFLITWSDINAGAWAEFRRGAKLPPQTPEPTCDVNFSALVSMAYELASQADEANLLYKPNTSQIPSTPIFKKRKFVVSSSPDPVPSSGGTVKTDEEQHLDPDYQPSSVHSDSS